MKRKLLSLCMALACAFTMANTVLAEDASPKVVLNQRELTFTDQQPVILEDRTLVPARGVFESMGAKVSWTEEKREVEISTNESKTRILLNIDNPTMQILTFNNIFAADKKEVTLDVAPQIINDRTMIPLRAISEALDADVEWNQEDYTVYIDTLKQPVDENGQPVEQKLTTLSLSADKTTAAAGETFTVSVDLSNLKENYADAAVSTVTATVKYDADKFEFVQAEAIANGEVIKPQLEGNNPAFKKDSVKSIYVLGETLGSNQDGSVLNLTFKSITGEKGSFALSNRITERGDDTAIAFIGADNESINLSSADVLTIDTTPLVINE